MYLTLDDLRTRFTDIDQAADHDGDGYADSDVIAKVIADTCSEMDGYLRGRYVLPILTPVPELTAFGCDIARYKVYGNAATELILRRYERACQWMRQIADGTVDLPIARLGADADGCIAAIAPTRTFTNTLFAGY